MKKKLLLKTMLLLCALIAGSGAMWADKATLNFGSTTGWTITKGGTSGTGGEIDMSKSGIQITGTNGYYDSGNHLRIYSSGTITITSNVGTITDMTITCTANKGSNNGPDKISTNTGTYSTSNNSKDGTWSGSATSILFTAGAQCRIAQIEVTYTPTASKTNTTLELSPNPLNLSYGGSTGTLTATVTPEGGTALTNPTISWESDNESVATVSGGTVTPVGEGSCTITATYAGDDDYNGSSNTATVNVTDTRTAVVSAITSINSIKSLYIGGKHAFTPVVTLADGLSESDVTYSYVSADPSTIQINDDGTYTALKTGTNINITVTVTPVAAKSSTHKPVSATFQHNGAYKYSKPVFTTTGETEGNFSGSMTLAMANDGTPTGPIYYTLDGDEPATDKSNCTLYSEELTLTTTKTVKARVIDDDGYYSTVTSASYTKVPANKDAISLAAGESLSFTDFSDVGTYWSSASKYIIASDGDKYKWTGTDVGNYSGSTLQIKNNTSAYITSSNVTSTNGFKLTLTYTGSVDVYVGETKQTAAKDGAYYFPTNTAITLKRGTSSTPQVSNITFTGLKEPIATDVAITDPGTLAKGATGTFAYTKTSEESSTKAWTSSKTDVIEIKDAATGAYEAKGRGTAKITLTITPTDATAYEEVSAELNVSVTEPVVITADNLVMTYGDAATAIGASTPNDYAGTLSYVSGNTAIATVDASGNVTAVAIGTTTITISAPADADNLYTAGEDKVINVTVNAPSGNTSFSEGNIYATTLKSSSAATGWSKDNKWSYDSTYGAVTATNLNSGTYDLTSKDIDLTGYTNISLEFSHTGKTFATPSNACKVYIQEGTNDPVQLSISYFSGNDWTYVSSGDIDLDAYKNKTVRFIFRYTPTSGNSGKWEVKDFNITGKPDVTVAASHYGSYCYEYPIDLDQLDDDVKAYIVTNVEGTTVTFTQITGTIKGGVPFILYGTSGSHTLTLANESTNVPDGNMLVGTLAPTYITTENGDYTNFGLSGGKFVKINPGTLPANKAYLPVLTANVPTTQTAPSFTIVFNDATGISQVENVPLANGNYYDLQGRRILNPTKGLYIVNGKKVVIK